MEWLPLFGGGGVVGGIGVLLTYLIGRKSEKTRASQAEAQKIRDSLAGNLELTKYIRDQIDEAQEALRAEIAELRKELRQVIERERDTKSIIRRWFQRLTWWDEKGRVGPMPMPAEADMHLLDLSDIEITAPTAEVHELRQPYVPPIPESPKE